jgi:hypothetical protein
MCTTGGNPDAMKMKKQPMKSSLALAGIFSFTLAGFAAEPALTIYNQNFAVVRDTVPLELKAGVNEVNFAGVTATAETDSVILRDPAGKIKLQVLEQSYRNDPVSQELLLQLNEGKTIDFVVRETNKPDHIVKGKIVRAGHEGVQYAQEAMAISEPYQRVIQIRRPNTSPIIEVDGKLQFYLPGEPIFPSLGDDTVLNPTLSWKLNSSEARKFDAEIAYITDGISWKADYNLVSPENADTIDIVGWVTFDNQCGKTFRNAKIKLMAGDVNRVEKVEMEDRQQAVQQLAQAAAQEQQVTEKAFSEFHLYTIGQPTTLRDQETKQVEFVRATGVKAPRLFIYDGASADYGVYEPVTGDAEYGVPTNKKVWVLREFKNSKENHLGMPLPKGVLRFYQQDDDKQLQFIGENEIDHTPKDETIRVYVGNSFDLTGERRRTDFKVDAGNHRYDETFEIKLRNHKKEAVEIRAVEHLSRYDNWEIKEKSDPFKQRDSSTIEFRVKLKPDEEHTLTYHVHYTW